LNAITWTLAGLAALWYGTFYAYVLVMAARAVRDRGELTGFHKAMFGPVLLVAWPLDVLFNVIHGTWMFRELPREWLFTTRCQRHVVGTDARRRRMALFWRRQLNPFDEGHV
jgi:hypothetical protein